MKNPRAALAAAVLVAFVACKPRQDTASSVREAGSDDGRAVVAEGRPNPLKSDEIRQLALRLDTILREGMALARLDPPATTESGFALAGGSSEPPNQASALAFISWTLSDIKVSSQALKQLGDDSGEGQQLEAMVQRCDAELNKRAVLMNYQLLFDSKKRDAEAEKNRQALLDGYTDGAPTDVEKLKKKRAESLEEAARQLAELKTEGGGFAGLECAVIGASPTTLAKAEFTEEVAQAVGKSLEKRGVSRKVGRGEGVCFDVAPGYPLFTIVTQKRCASAFQPDDPRVMLHASADTGEGEIFAYVLPKPDFLESVCFSRVAATQAVSAEPAATPTYAGAFKKMVSSIFVAPEDCEGVAQRNPELCTNSECRAVATGNISECYSKDCRAIILKRSSACGSTDCRGIIRRVIDDCVSNYCRAIVGEEFGMCRWAKETL